MHQMFERLRPIYDERMARATFPYPFGGYDELLDALVERAGALEQRRVLDMAVHTGNLSVRFALAGAHVTAILPQPCDEPHALMLARRLHDVRLLTSPDAEERFDVVVAAYAITTLDDDARHAWILTALEKHLAPRGVLLLADASFATAQQRDAQLTAWNLPTHHALAMDLLRDALVPKRYKLTYAQLAPCGGLYKIKRR